MVVRSRCLALFFASLPACGPTIDVEEGAEGHGETEVPETSGAGMTTGPSTTTASAESESGRQDRPDTMPPVCGGIPISMPMAEVEQARAERGMGEVVRLRISKHDFECGGSFHRPECGGTWSVSIGLPPEAQQVGVYDMADFNVGFTDMPEQEEPNCTGTSTGGGAGSGTMEVLAWEADCVALRFSDVALPVSFDFDGEIVAGICS